MSTKRFRERGSPDYEPIIGTYITAYPDGSSTSVDISIDDANGLYGWMTDHKISKFRERIARGEIIINPMYSKEISRLTTGTGVSYQRSDTNFNVYTDNTPRLMVNQLGFVSPRLVHIDLENLRTIAGTKAWSNVASPEFQGLVFLAELREVVGFLRRPMSNLNDYLDRELRKARKKRKANRKRRLGDDYKTVPFRQHIGDNWLAYRYGLRPLVSDLENAAQGVASLQFKPPPRFTARGKFDWSDSEEIVDEYLHSDSSVCTSREGQTTRTINVRAGVMYEADHTDTFGMNMAQIPITAWEVIPFSFVADWFVNVGDYIQAITPKLGVRVIGHWSTMKDTSVTEASTVGNAPNERITLIQGTMDEVVTSESKQRWTTCPKGLTTHPLPWRGSLGTKRIADSFALLQQILTARV